MSIVLKGQFLKEADAWVLTIPSHDLMFQSPKLLPGLKGIRDQVRELSLIDGCECFLLIQDNGIFYIEVKTKVG